MSAISPLPLRMAGRLVALVLVGLGGVDCSEVTSPLPASQVEIESWNLSDETPDLGSRVVLETELELP